MQIVSTQGGCDCKGYKMKSKLKGSVSDEPKDDNNLSQYGPIKQIQNLIFLAQESKRKQGEYLLSYVSDKALAKEYKKRQRKESAWLLG